MATDIRGRIEEFRPYIPLIQGLRNPGMRNRHWELLSESIQMNIKPKANFTFSRCLELKLQDHIEAIAKVAEVAGKEYAIEQVGEQDNTPVKAVAGAIVNLAFTFKALVTLTYEGCYEHAAVILQCTLLYSIYCAICYDFTMLYYIMLGHATVNFYNGYNDCGLFSLPVNLTVSTQFFQRRKII